MSCMIFSEFSFDTNLVAKAVQVVRFPYRSARVLNPMFRIERYSQDKEDESWNREEYEGIVECLDKAAGTSMRDNHVTYELTFKDGGKLAIQLTDGIIIIGTGVRKEYW